MNCPAHRVHVNIVLSAVSFMLSFGYSLQKQFYDRNCGHINTIHNHRKNGKREDVGRMAGGRAKEQDDSPAAVIVLMREDTHTLFRCHKTSRDLGHAMNINRSPNYIRRHTRHPGGQEGADVQFRKDNEAGSRVSKSVNRCAYPPSEERSLRSATKPRKQRMRSLWHERQNSRLTVYIGMGARFQDSKRSVSNCVVVLTRALVAWMTRAATRRLKTNLMTEVLTSKRCSGSRSNRASAKCARLARDIFG